jgi:hypothetical protein
VLLPASGRCPLQLVVSQGRQPRKHGTAAPESVGRVLEESGKGNQRWQTTPADPSTTDAPAALRECSPAPTPAASPTSYPHPHATTRRGVSTAGRRQPAAGGGGHCGRRRGYGVRASRGGHHPQRGLRRRIRGHRGRHHRRPLPHAARRCRPRPRHRRGDPARPDRPARPPRVQTSSPPGNHPASSPTATSGGPATCSVARGVARSRGRPRPASTSRACAA